MLEKLGKLGKLVWEDKSDPVETAKAVQAKPQLQPVASQTVIATNPDTPSVLDVAQVESTIEGLIQAAPEFSQVSTFVKNVQSLASVIADEATRFKAASATTAIPKAALLESVGSYKQVLANETANFETNFCGAMQQKIDAANAEEAEIASQIDQLTAQLADLSERKNSRAKEAVNVASEMAKAKIDFASVTQTIDRRYTDLSNKLQQYLGA